MKLGNKLLIFYENVTMKLKQMKTQQLHFEMKRSVSVKRSA